MEERNYVHDRCFELLVIPDLRERYEPPRFFMASYLLPRIEPQEWEQTHPNEIWQGAYSADPAPQRDACQMGGLAQAGCHGKRGRVYVDVPIVHLELEGLGILRGVPFEESLDVL